MIGWLLLSACASSGDQPKEGSEPVGVADEAEDVSTPPDPTPVDTGWPEIEESGCVPDEDPAISAEELLTDMDLLARYLGARVDVDPGGSWDFSGIGQIEMTMRWHSLDGLWFGDRFVGATHAGALDLAGEQWAIYRAAEDGLWLLGVASWEEGETALSYSPAVQLWAYPISEGDSIHSEVAAEGIYEGIEYPRDVGWGNTVRLVHSYSVSASGNGDVTVDAGTYAAQQVTIEGEALALDDYDLEYGSERSTTWLYLSACVGTVARIGEGEFMGLGL
jgi:hypothetical protein